MRIIDVFDRTRVDRAPDGVARLLSDGRFAQDEFTIRVVELRLYTERHDERLGSYSLITSYVETDRGSVEMTYDEGFRGENALEGAADLLASGLGISALVLRSAISLRGALARKPAH